MTIGRVKIEALKLMYANSRDIHEDDLDELGADQNYSDYLAAMPGCINRALQDMVVRMILPRVSVKLDVDGKELEVIKVKRPEQLYSIARISATTPDDYAPTITYYEEGDRIVLLGYKKGAEYAAEGYPRIEEVSTATRNEAVLPIPEELAAVIPYFIKSELYAMDGRSNAEEASQARQYYEMQVARYADEPVGGIRKSVRMTFGGW